MSDVNDVNNVHSANSAVDVFISALTQFQDQMKGDAEKAGLFTEDDVENWVTQSRREENVQMRRLCVINEVHSRVGAVEAGI